jgi:hypothetical protein
LNASPFIVSVTGPVTEEESTTVEEWSIDSAIVPQLELFSEHKNCTRSGKEEATEWTLSVSATRHCCANTATQTAITLR